MITTKRKWAFPLICINLAVALVILIQAVGNHIPSVRELLQMLGYALVYANLTGVIGFLVISTLAERLAPSMSALVALVAGGVIVFAGVGCLLAQTILMELRIIVPLHFWREYLDTLRIGLPLAIVFGLGAFVHGSLRERVQLMEQQLQQKDVAEERTRKLAAEARLRSLESRIHPHFLFNTLNSIISLIATNPARAEQIVARLAALLRASLDSTNRPLISLREELAMVESYIDIERVRFGDKFRGSVELPDELQDDQVPPMSVQSLVENAVKHGITPQEAGGEILVSVSAQKDKLHIEVRDTGPGFELADIRAGHGLDNLVQRLDALFGPNARLNVARRDGRSLVEMILPRL